jgi:hypothetical protein
MIVLSTSKNAAAVRSGGVSSDDSTSRAADAASPDSRERWRRSLRCRADPVRPVVTATA